MDDTLLYIVLIFTLVLFFFSFFIIYIAVLQNKRKHIFQQELLRTQLEIQEHTLKNVSQEIHDNIGQALSLVKLNLSTVQNLKEEKFADALYLVSKAIIDLRDLSRSLHGEKIAEAGLVAAIENELKLVRNTGHFNVIFSLQGSVTPTVPQTEMILFRIVQEALHNTMKHSAGTGITVTMEYAHEKLRLSIADNGKGFYPENLQAGIGLKSIKNRVAMIGGTLIIQSAPDAGTELIINLPLS